MEQMKNPIKVVELIPTDVYDANTDGSAVDLRPSDNLAFDAGLIIVNVGDINGTPDEVSVKIEESDSSTFASGNTIMEGGEEFAVAAGTQYTLETKRTKRYMRAVITFDGGTSPDATIDVTAVLNNWALPFNRLA